MITDHQLFTPQLFEFLADLAANNNRSWFNEHKERYIRHAKEPLLTFIGEMGQRLEQISPAFIADPRANGGSMFRIYRDTRFSKDKSPYKRNIGCQFRHSAGKDAHAPGFYVHLEPGNCFAGGGIWKPPMPQLTRIREAIAHRSGEWQGVKEFISSSDSVGMMESERLIRAPKGFDPEHPMIEDLKAKSFFAGRYFPEQEVTSIRFPEAVEMSFLDLLPLMRFLATALDLSF